MLYHLLPVVLFWLVRVSCSDDDRPVISELLTSSKLVANKKFFLTCHLASGKPPNEFEWSLNGKRIIPNDQVNINQQEDYSTLNIRSMTSLFNGEFSCKVRNPFGEDSRTAPVKLNGERLKFKNYE